MNKKPDGSIEDYVEDCNRIAMKFLSNDKFNQAMSYLNQSLFKVRTMTECPKKSSLSSLTYSNLGNFYKKLGQTDQALDFFFQSLEFESPESTVEFIASIHLTISELLSSKSEHERALRYGIKSLMILKKEFKLNPQLIIPIIHCYSRIGIEYRALGQLMQAMQCFKKGFDICSKIKKNSADELKKNFKRMYVECVAEGGGKKTLPQTLSSKSNKKNSPSPKTSVDSHTTVWTLSNSQKANTPKSVQKSSNSHVQRRSLALPPMDEFNCGQKVCLGKLYESDEGKKKKKINASKHRQQEKLAATLIQAHWRGYSQRKLYFSMLLAKKIKEAEGRARSAIGEIKRLKNLAKNQKISRKK